MLLKKIVILFLVINFSLQSWALAPLCARVHSPDQQFSRIQQFSHFMQGPADTNSFGRWLYYPVRALLPLPLPERVGPTGKIFMEQWKNPSYEPTSTEWALIRRAGAEKSFRDKAAYLQQYPISAQFRRWVHQGYRKGMSLGTILALYFTFLVSQNQITGNEYQLQTLADDEIQVISETVPFPHLALRIDDRVYSYGVTHMTVTPLAQYLSSHLMRQTSPERQTQAQKFDWGQSSAAGMDVLMRALNPLMEKLKQEPRSLQVVTLKITRQQKLNLRRDLEMATGMRYQNHTMVTDCSTMIVEALRKHTSVRVPRYLDAFPLSTISYLASLGALGDSAFQSAMTVMLEKESSTSRHLWRNFYWMSMEAKVFLFLFPQNAYGREWVELYFRNEGLQKHDPETLEEIARWAQDVRLSFDEDPQVRIFRRQHAALLAESTRVSVGLLDRESFELKKQLFIETSEEWFSSEIERVNQSLSSEVFDFKKSILDQHRLTNLLETQNELQLKD